MPNCQSILDVFFWGGVLKEGQTPTTVQVTLQNEVSAPVVSTSAIALVNFVATRKRCILPQD